MKSVKLSVLNNGFVVEAGDGSWHHADINSAINVVLKELGFTVPEVVLCGKAEVQKLADKVAACEAKECQPVPATEVPAAE
jgi:hypothetical protein